LTDHRFGYATRELPIGPIAIASVAGQSRDPGLPGASVEGTDDVHGLNRPSRAFAAATCDWLQRAESPFMSKIDRLSKVWPSSFFKAL
jgi:hypothetical protein